MCKQLLLDSSELGFKRLERGLSPHGLRSLSRVHHESLGGFASGLVRGANPRAYSTRNSSECGLRWHARLRKIHGPA